MPEVSHPGKKLDLKEKLKWTLTSLIIYFLMSQIPLYGLEKNYESQFKTLSILLAAKFGSLISLGIGPIVTASIVLQLLVGAEVIKVDTNTHQGRQMFQGLQKLFSIAFIIIQNVLYVVSGSLPAANGALSNVVLISVQLILGSLIIMFLDEVISKWGIGSGISLFIAAGVSRQIFINAFNPMLDPSMIYPVGLIPRSLVLFFNGAVQEAFWALFIVLITFVIIMVSTYLQSIKVELPLTFGRFRGFSYRYPLKFIYTSNMPVIFTATLIASMQFWGLSLYNMGYPILGSYKTITDNAGIERQVPESGLVYYLNPPQLRQLITNGLKSDYVTSLIVYASFMIIGSVLFSLLWINIGGQGAESVADQLISAGLNIPGFRSSRAILIKVLDRYIKPLTILGGATVGAVAVIADLFGALSRGTGILLTVMIIFQLYDQLKREHFNELPEFMKKLGKT